MIDLKDDKYPTQERMLEVMEYNPTLGTFTWLFKTPDSTAKKMFNTRYAGNPVGFIAPDGYRACTLDGASMLLMHRLAFIYMTGECPEFVDHINGRRSDNRWKNLREATRAENQQNAVGCGQYPKGVTYQSGRRNPYYAAIRIDGKLQHLGVFPTAEDAAAAYNSAAQDQHGEFYRDTRKAG